MFITRNEITTVSKKEVWIAGKTDLEKGDAYSSARINIDTHGGRIRCYGRNNTSAEHLRDFILRAVEAYNGI